MSSKFIVPFALLFISPLIAKEVKETKLSKEIKPEKESSLLIGETQSSLENPYLDCGLDQKSRALAKLIINDPRQNRKKLVCNPLLSKIAKEKAREMAKLGRVHHYGSSAANRRLRNNGYPLAQIYPTIASNNVEAIAGGISEPIKMWKEFKNSEAHRIHLLAEHDFYLLQDEIGVGFHYDIKSPHVEYWVVYVAHRANKRFDGQVAKSKD